MSQMLMMQLEVTQNVFQVNTEAVSHAESLQAPAESGNCMNWIAGHLVTTYNSILPSLGEEVVWDESRTEIYKRGSGPLADAATAVDFAEIKEAFATSHTRVMRGIGSLPTERWDEPAPYSPGNNPDETLGTLFHLIAFHQAYHVGQLGLGRRLLGKDGGIE
jgi:uncharacterized damage-inducible protein DinB